MQTYREYPVNKKILLALCRIFIGIRNLFALYIAYVVYVRQQLHFKRHVYKRSEVIS